MRFHQPNWIIFPRYRVKIIEYWKKEYWTNNMRRHGKPPPRYTPFVSICCIFFFQQNLRYKALRGNWTKRPSPFASMAWVVLVVTDGSNGQTTNGEIRLVMSDTHLQFNRKPLKKGLIPKGSKKRTYSSNPSFFDEMVGNQYALPLSILLS